jgi:hypothetical protein
VRNIFTGRAGENAWGDSERAANATRLVEEEQFPWPPLLCEMSSTFTNPLMRDLKPPREN